MLEEIKKQSEQAVRELLALADPGPKSLVVIGCSTSEVGGEKIGTHSNMEIAEAIYQGIAPLLAEKGLYLAAQCCEHLNRSVIIEEEAARYYGLEEVNVMPQMKAGGSFATTACAHFDHPVAVEEVKAACGIDIGGTLIGMHLKRVAVPVRLSIRKIGEAPIICARTRPKFIGGERAHYNPDLL